jgi:hypothetical protein
MFYKKQKNENLPPNVAKGKWNGKVIHYRTDRIIVQLEPLPKGRVIRYPKATGRVIYSVGEISDNIELAKKLSKLKEVKYAEPDAIVTGALTPNDTRLSEQWGIDTIGAIDGWDLETGGKSNILIAIMDSGISIDNVGNLNHPDLNSSKFILGTDFVNGGTPRDEFGHGTHVFSDHQRCL